MTRRSDTSNADGRSCCCIAPPAVRVVLRPKSRTSSSVEILMCGHHYRVAKAGLSRMNAMVFDQSGQLLASGGQSVRSTVS
jgi:hypothetical protein